MTVTTRRMLIGIAVAMSMAAAGAFLVFSPTSSDGQPTTMGSCKYTKINTQGVTNQDITVSSAAVPILTGSAYRCSGLIYNSGAGDMRCAPDTAFVPTSSTGMLIKAGASLTLSSGEVTRQWQCIRTSADTTANVMEVATQ